jgi:oxygen-independent coproporphyrinogen-3 oxidase
MEASLYIHVPFCDGACDYCDFYSVGTKSTDRRKDLFVDALLEDAESALRGVSSVPSVYVGGGTPSALGAARAARLFSALSRMLPRTDSFREWTVEANPESADRAFLEACRDHGVNRVSLGVQTFHEPSRRAVNRTGRGSVLGERLSLARELFGASYSADLITGLPLQDEDVLRGDIERLLSYEPGHLSLYSLTLDPDTLQKNARLSRSLPPPDEADRLWITGRDLLEEAGYEQYEVSSFRGKGGPCLHNIRYWRMESWLGLGPSASGTLIDEAAGRGRRFTVRGDVDAWLGARRGATLASELVTRESLDTPTLIRETFLMGFRYAEGPDSGRFVKRFGAGMEDFAPETVRTWKERGLLREAPLSLTREGLLFLNPFLRDVFSELSHRPLSSFVPFRPHSR